MATITTATYLDGGIARTASEAMTINTGGELTVRTDHRVHANAPASNTGSLGSVTINEGKLIWDSTAVRLMPYNTGSGNVPAIGTTITQGGVSGYLLGVWASKTVANTAVGATMPASGFIKFREVTGGSFSAGALTGIGASATGPDVQGWISIAHDAASNFTVRRLGEHRARGGRFFLEDTNGTIGQIFQVPTEGSAVMYAPGLWIETGVATGYYEYWPGLFSATNGWAHQHIGEAEGATDARQNFLKILAGGQLQMGESYTQASTYASLAAQVGTYAEVTHSCTYTWINNIVEVYYATGHLLETGMQTGLDFTSGGATANDGIYTVTVLSPYIFTVPLAGSGTAGNVTSKPGVTVTFASHRMNIGESVYCDFTSGTGVDGTYEIYAAGASTYLLKYPHVSALTSGAVSCLHSLTVTFTANNLAVGNKVYLDFTSGTGVDGQYTIKTVVDANNYRVNFAHSATTSGNVTMKRTIGNVVGAGRRTWIPSNILNECATGARATNTVPNTTQDSRPEWITTSAGAIDLEYVYGCSGFPTFAQPYSVRLRNCAFFDQVIISECATALDIDGLNLSMQGAMDLISLSLTSNFAGGTIANGKFHRGNTPGATDHAGSTQYCKGVTFNNVQAGIIQFARSTGLPFAIWYSDGITLNNCRSINGNVALTASNNITVNDHDHCDRFNGRTNTGSLYGVLVGAMCNNIIVDGFTSGFGGTIPDCHPFAGIVNYSNDGNVKVRNIGSKASPFIGGTWAPNAYGMGYLGVTGGNNNTIKFQRCYVDKVRTGHVTNINSDKNMLYESVDCGFYVWSTKALMSVAHADLNGQLKLFKSIHLTTGQASVYGTHFMDILMGDDYGRFILNFNEPTAETASIFTMNNGTAKWNSSGGILLEAVGNQATWEDNVFRKGYTGFAVEEAVLTGPTQTRFLVEYQIDTGSGFSGWHNCYRLITATGGSSGAYTFTLANSTGLEVGDYCFGTGLSAVGIRTKNPTVPRITNINGTTITVDVANTGTVSGNIRFNHLPFETIDPAVGFKLKYRLTVVTTETVACTSLGVGTLTTAAAQSENLYPLDTNTLTLTGLPTGCDLVVLSAGTTTILAQQDAVNSTSLSYTYSGAHNVDIGIIKPGYIPFYIRNLALASVDSSIPVSLTPDRNYTA